MSDIVSAIASVKTVMSEIAHSTQEQAQGIALVTHAVSDLDLMTQQNAALVEESAAAADSLRMQAQNLTHTVSRFRI
jgi:methyl-accepting chemotaxis protein